MSPGRSGRPVPVPLTGRTEDTLRVLYLGVLTLLLLEQFVLGVPPRGYLDVTLLFGAATLAYGVSRARTALRNGGGLSECTRSVVPVALVGAGVGTVIAVSGGVESTAGAVATGLLTFVVVLLAVILGAQAVVDLRRRRQSGPDGPP